MPRAERQLLLDRPASCPCRIERRASGGAAEAVPKTGQAVPIEQWVAKSTDNQKRIQAYEGRYLGRTHQTSTQVARLLHECNAKGETLQARCPLLPERRC